jgi:opacity protein-like surface antigen
VYAQQSEASSDDGRWHFEVTPYLWAANQLGTFGVKGVNVATNQSFTQISNQLTDSASLTFAAQKDLWLFAADLQYYKLSDAPVGTWTGPLGNNNTAGLQVTTTQRWDQFSFGRRLMDDATKIDVFASGRYTSIDSNATLTTSSSGSLINGSRSAAGSVNWWDPVIAVRLTSPIAEKWTAVAYYDFGWVSTSDNSYQLYAGVNYQFWRHITAKVGYRYLNQNYSSGNLTNYHVEMDGLNLGIGIPF